MSLPEGQVERTARLFRSANSSQAGSDDPLAAGWQMLVTLCSSAVGHNPSVCNYAT